MKILAVLCLAVFLGGCSRPGNPVAGPAENPDISRPSKIGCEEGRPIIPAEKQVVPTIADDRGLLPATGAVGPTGPSNVTIRIVGVFRADQ